MASVIKVKVCVVCVLVLLILCAMYILYRALPALTIVSDYSIPPSAESLVKFKDGHEIIPIAFQRDDNSGQFEVVLLLVDTQSKISSDDAEDVRRELQHRCKAWLSLYTDQRGFDSAINPSDYNGTRQVKYHWPQPIVWNHESVPGWKLTIYCYHPVNREPVSIVRVEDLGPAFLGGGRFVRSGKYKCDAIPTRGL